VAENQVIEERISTDLSADEARQLGRDLDERGDALKRHARAWFAYADALDGSTSEPAELTGTATGKGGANGDLTTGRAAPAAPPSNKRPLILVLIKERPVPGWSPNEIRRVLIERRMIPSETSAASIRVTLGRMADRGQLVKTPNGLYTLPGYEQEGTLG
jgi:hypothetical protein